MNLAEYINSIKEFEIPFEDPSLKYIDLAIVKSDIEEYNAQGNLKKKIVLITSHHLDCLVKTTELDDAHCIVLNLNYINHLFCFHEILQNYTAAELLNSKSLIEYSNNLFRIFLLKFISYKFCTNGKGAGTIPFTLNYYSVIDNIEKFENDPLNTELHKVKDNIIKLHEEYAVAIFTLHIRFIIRHEIAHIYLNEHPKFKEDAIISTKTNLHLLLNDLENLHKNNNQGIDLSFYLESINYVLTDKYAVEHLTELVCDQISIAECIDYDIIYGNGPQKSLDYNYIAFLQHSQFRSNLSGYNSFFNRYIPLSVEDVDFNTDFFYEKLTATASRNLKLETCRMLYIEEIFMHLGDVYQLAREENASNKLYISNKMYRYAKYGWNNLATISYSYLNIESTRKWMRAIKDNPATSKADEFEKLSKNQDLCTILNWKR